MQVDVSKHSNASQSSGAAWRLPTARPPHDTHVKNLTAGHPPGYGGPPFERSWSRGWATAPPQRPTSKWALNHGVARPRYPLPHASRIRLVENCREPLTSVDAGRMAFVSAADVPKRRLRRQAGLPVGHFRDATSALHSHSIPHPSLPGAPAYALEARDFPSIPVQGDTSEGT